jgi:hypothetical protein
LGHDLKLRNLGDSTVLFFLLRATYLKPFPIMCVTPETTTDYVQLMAVKACGFVFAILHLLPGGVPWGARDVIHI